MQTIPPVHDAAAPDTRRGWLASAAIALATAYVPTLVPFVSGPLTECDHCVDTYLELLAIVPGLAAGLLVGEGGFVVVAGLTSAAIVVGTMLAARRLRNGATIALCGPLALLIGLESAAIAMVLRA